MTSLAKQRAAKGLCPRCGELAAPYYLCDRHHQLDQIGKVCKALAAQGAVEISRCPDDRRKSLFHATGRRFAPGELRYNGLELGERGKPRLRGGIPVDVEEEVIRLLTDYGRPMHIEGIAEAWVKLRRKPGQTSAASGMAAIIKAKDKRARRAQRNRMLAQRSA